MKISDLLDTSNVVSSMPARNKEDAIGSLVKTLAASLDKKTLESVHKAVMERENIMSTGVGKGLAIPHGKCR
jgi:mannitol/fructose-specific phosphotransferase system IIA component (Ntr-type)